MKEPRTLDAALTAATEPDADVQFTSAMLEIGNRLLPDTCFATAEQESEEITGQVLVAITPEPEPEDTGFYPGPLNPYRIPPQPETFTV